MSAPQVEVVVAADEEVVVVADKEKIADAASEEEPRNLADEADEDEDMGVSLRQLPSAQKKKPIVEEADEEPNAEEEDDAEGDQQSQPSYSVFDFHSQSNPSQPSTPPSPAGALPSLCARFRRLSSYVVVCLCRIATRVSFLV